jgi:hypothetical protein
MDPLQGENLGSDHAGWTGRRWRLCTVTFLKASFWRTFFKV